MSMKLILAVLFMSSLSLPASAAQAPSRDEKAVRGIVEGSVNSVLGILRDKKLDIEKKKKKVRAAVEPVFDFKLMGKLTLGRKNWPKFDVGQKKEYSDLFMKTIQDSFFEKMGLFTDETVEFEKPVATKKNKFEMPIRIISKGKPYILTYKLRRKGGAWKVYDLEIEGISLIRSFGSQYDQFLRKSTPAELLVKMREKAFAAPKGLEDDETVPPKKKGKKKKKK